MSPQTIQMNAILFNARKEEFKQSRKGKTQAKIDRNLEHSNNCANPVHLYSNDYNDWNVPDPVIQTLNKGLKYINIDYKSTRKQWITKNWKEGLASFLHRLVKHKDVGPFTYRVNPFAKVSQTDKTVIKEDPPIDGEDTPVWNDFKNNIWNKGCETINGLSERYGYLHQNGPSSRFQTSVETVCNKDDIIIKPADKGNNIVILNKRDYLIEANRQLSDNNTYKKVSFPISKSRHSEIISILSNLNKEDFLTNRMMKKLSPKLEATDRMPPGRPVVCYRGSDLHPLSCWISADTSPLSIYTIIQTADVDALYPSIDPDWGLQCIAKQLYNWPKDNRPDEAILKLLQICLKSNDFVFEGERYLQIKGTAMGVSFSPAYANIVLGVWEEDVYTIYKEHLLVYRRYIDDILIVWRKESSDTVGEDDRLREFWNYLNNRNEGISLTRSEAGNTTIFLDLEIQLNPLVFKTHFKPTDSRRLLNPKSAHPKHTIKGILFAQALRYLRNCSKIDTAKGQLNDLRNLNKDLGYTKSMFKEAWLKATKRIEIERQEFEGMKPCNGRRCLVCLKVRKTNTWQSTGSNQWFRVKGDFDCTSSWIIYIIQCTLCEIQYVGLTTRTLRDRINNHKGDVRNGSNKLVSDHFRKHGIDQMTYWVCDSIPEEDPNREKTLQTLEARYIKEANTVTPYGLNEDHGCYSTTIVPLVVYHPSPWYKLNRILKDHWSALNDDSPLKAIRPIIALKLGRSLGSLIVKGRTEGPPQEDNTNTLNLLECWPSPWWHIKTVFNRPQNKFSIVNNIESLDNSNNTILTMANSWVGDDQDSSFAGINLLLEIQREIDSE
ncbi:DgyrCDS14716 [Dimorphilus gyrociliatus]|uniref:DgyrCDS14716 n=1 Tax=Dimorphilus gyrociliatus TaxID=2664684 RepID=A0A7I8WEL2_9ANNE|nr:DgyrCDS14716 [Dimorphilus gyrociliatus]